MEVYPSLHELLAHSAQGRQYFDSLSATTREVLQQQRQNIRTFADLRKVGAWLEETPHR